MADFPSISVVIPCYNSEKSLSLVVSRVETVLTPRVASLEFVLVEDGSRDRTWEVISNLAHENTRVRGVRFMRNYGQHNALLCGIRAARHDVVVTMDDDLQNRPEDIPLLIAKLSEGYDVVYGTPHKESHGLLRNLASKITKVVLQKSMGAETARSVSAFRAFRTWLRDGFENYGGTLVSIDVLLTWSTNRFIAVRVTHEQRTIGVSNYTLRALFRHSMNMMTGFSILPLQLASFVGFAFTLFGVGVFLYVLARYLIQGSSVQGFPFLASVIAIFSGAQLFALGIIGEYLARIHLRSMDRPSFTIDTKTDGTVRRER
jgi:glycosyltransferase involved in cell wall biosynthesis